MSRAEELGSAELLELVADRRWFAAKGREPDAAHVSGIAHIDGDFELVLVEVGFPEGTHETYLLPLHFDGGDPHDALEHADDVCKIAALCGVETPCADVRPIGVEQSNSSVVLDEQYVLKVYRRLDAGPNPELELLQALREAGFPHAPRLAGALEHESEPLGAALAVVTELVPAAGDGWELTLDALAAGDLEWLPRRARRLGEVTGAMHTALSTSDDPHLAPEEPSTEAIPLLAATVDEEIERLAAEVPELAKTGLAARLETVRDLVHDLGHVGPPGLVIRIHGDFHLGQVLWTEAEDWVVIDFEGEPSNSLAERRRRTSALKDVAGMLRSFAYVADGAKLLRKITVPDGWEWSCRAAFLDGWRETVDARLLPMSEGGIERLLELHELQKLVYELRYELRNRPDWVPIPLSGIERLLQRI